MAPRDEELLARAYPEAYQYPEDEFSGPVTIMPQAPVGQGRDLWPAPHGGIVPYPIGATGIGSGRIALGSGPKPDTTEDKLTFWDYVKAFPVGVSIGKGRYYSPPTPMAFGDLERSAWALKDERKYRDEMRKLGTLFGIPELQGITTPKGIATGIELLRNAPLGTDRAMDLLRGMYGKRYGGTIPQAIPQTPDPMRGVVPGMWDEPLPTPGLPGGESGWQSPEDLPPELKALAEFLGVLPRREVARGLLGGRGGLSQLLGGAGSEGQRLRQMLAPMAGNDPEAQAYVFSIPDGITAAQVMPIFNGFMTVLRRGPQELEHARQRAVDDIRARGQHMSPDAYASTIARIGKARTREEVWQIHADAVRGIPQFAPQDPNKAYKDFENEIDRLNQVVNAKATSGVLEAAVMQNLISGIPEGKRSPLLTQMLEDPTRLVNPKLQEQALRAKIDYLRLAVIPNLAPGFQPAARDRLNAIHQAAFNGEPMPGYAPQQTGRAPGQPIAFQTEAGDWVINDPTEYRFVSNQLQTPLNPEHINLAHYWARYYGIDPLLGEALMRGESGGDPRAKSYNTQGQEVAHGLMQINVLSGTARELGLDMSNIYDPNRNIQAGMRYFRQMLDLKGGRADLAIAAYNAGPGAVSNTVPVNGQSEFLVPRVLALAHGLQGDKVLPGQGIAATGEPVQGTGTRVEQAPVEPLTADEIEAVDRYKFTNPNATPEDIARLTHALIGTRAERAARAAQAQRPGSTSLGQQGEPPQEGFESLSEGFGMPKSLTPQWATDAAKAAKEWLTAPMPGEAPPAGVLDTGPTPTAPPVMVPSRIRPWARQPLAGAVRGRAVMDLITEIMRGVESGELSIEDARRVLLDDLGLSPEDVTTILEQVMRGSQRPHPQPQSAQPPATAPAVPEGSPLP